MHLYTFLPLLAANACDAHFYTFGMYFYTFPCTFQCTFIPLQSTFFMSVMCSTGIIIVYVLYIYSLHSTHACAGDHNQNENEDEDEDEDENEDEHRDVSRDVLSHLEYINETCIVNDDETVPNYSSQWIAYSCGTCGYSCCIAINPCCHSFDHRFSYIV